ncbi:hypothetical protein ACFV0Y_16910 [Streptomyces sp. NPDC059569]|uniref:hypothetical protein n=1 Tax=Streptomyces sp. NPDC059569 TaxID=3346869 RepID=UPI003691CD96
MPDSTDGPAPEQRVDGEPAGKARRRDAYVAFLDHVAVCSYCCRGAGHCSRGERLRWIWRKALAAAL